MTVGASGVTTTTVGPLGVFANALDVRADGAIFVASLDRLYRLDPASGAATEVSRAPFPVLSAGDLAFGPDGSLYLTSDANGGELVRVSPDLTTWTLVGATGVAGLGGLRSLGGTLTGYGHRGDIYQINPATAATTYEGYFTAVWLGLGFRLRLARRFRTFDHQLERDDDLQQGSAALGRPPVSDRLARVDDDQVAVILARELCAGVFRRSRLPEAVVGAVLGPVHREIDVGGLHPAPRPW